MALECEPGLLVEVGDAMSEKKSKKPNIKPEYKALFYAFYGTDIITVKRIDDLLKIAYKHNCQVVIHPVSYGTKRVLERHREIVDDIDFEIWLNEDAILS